MVNATNSDGNSSDTTNQRGKDGEKLQDEGSTPRMNRLEIKKKWTIWDSRSHMQKYNQK